jgi:hypothetical protein
MYNRAVRLLALLLASSIVASCAQGTSPEIGEAAVGVATGATSTADAPDSSTDTSGDGAANAADHDDPADYVWDEDDVVSVSLDGDSISTEATSAVVDGTTITLTAAGTYRISGTLEDGQIIVDASDEIADEAVVRLILDGVDITNTTNAAIAVTAAAKVVIVLAEGTDNNLTDGAGYAFADPDQDEPNAALYSAADLTITGEGSLTVTGNYNDGIAGKDGLIVGGGTITVDAADDGIRGKDYVVIEGGEIIVAAGGDGVKSDNEDDATMGYITIAGGAVDVTAAGDGIQGATDVLVTDGEIAVATGGGSTGNVGGDGSAKGIKGADSVVIDGATITVDAADDAIHSDGAVAVNNGSITISTGDDGVHADATVTISGGAIDILESYEGVESAIVTIDGGNVDITSSDDGLNVAGGNDGSGRQGPGGGGRGDAFADSGDYLIVITVVVTAGGDGIDANGSIVMTGGTVLVHGPTADNNGAIDYDGSFDLSGGVLVAAGSAGMAQGPGAGSSQAFLHLSFVSTQEAGTVVHIEASDVGAVLTFEPGKDYQSLVFSSPDLVAGGAYDLSLGGAGTGDAVGGMYTADAYTPGTEVGTLTAS